jgi:hypothetical protein
MIVKHNGKNLLSIANPEGKNIVLMPGNNVGIDPVLWESLTKDNKVLQAKIENRIIEVRHSKVETAKPEEKKVVQKEVKEEIEKGASKDLAEFNAKEAAKIVAETYDVSILEEWSYEESRVSVKKAIDKQLKAIEETAA